MNAAVVTSDQLPASVKQLYGRLRHRFGVMLYRSRLCPARTSPSHIIALALRSGYVYIDVGANDGQMVGIASAAVGSSGQVFAFEPQASMFEWLERMCAAYNLSNVVLSRSVVGHYHGEVVFFGVGEIMI